MLLSTIKIVDYDKATGQILRVIAWPDPMDAARHYPGCLYLPEHTDTDDVRRYVKDREVVDRPEMPVTLDGQFLLGVPEGAMITIDGVEYTADGSPAIEVEFEYPARYEIVVSKWPYLDARFIHEDFA
ncbi:hypothetical protein [Pseudomonas entomophila]|uniref:Phage protein n=2 Tax=Pseudomonas entomophila TaxID=312306 RepID=A0ABY9QVM8_9PSED|nr:hypothetical protein [Pseudomonas entomophila]WMW07409.1 hypothetical protein RAH46_08710 [Pseudomonas entomophila]CAK16859.1 putative phage protein [Pseudomonas entomophila L48]